MSTNYKGYDLNDHYEDPWYDREIAVFKAIIDKGPNASDTLVSGQHTHNKLVNPNTGTTVVTIDAISNITFPLMGTGTLSLDANHRVVTDAALMTSGYIPVYNDTSGAFINSTVKSIPGQLQLGDPTNDTTSYIWQDGDSFKILPQVTDATVVINGGTTATEGNLRIQKKGVGIGTSVSDNPQSALVIGGGLSVGCNIALTNGDASFAGSVNVNGDATILGDVYMLGNPGVSDNVRHYFDESAVYTIYPSTTYTTIIGKVGMGVSNFEPVERLHVDGNLRLGSMTGTERGLLSNQLIDTTSVLYIESSVWGESYDHAVVSLQNPGGKVCVGGNNPKTLLDVRGALRIGTTSDAASAGNAGAMRYRETDGTSYMEMCMLTDATTHAWVILYQSPVLA